MEALLAGKLCTCDTSNRIWETFNGANISKSERPPARYFFTQKHWWKNGLGITSVHLEPSSEDCLKDISKGNFQMIFASAEDCLCKKFTEILKEAKPHSELNISFGCYRRISHGWDMVNLLFWICVCSYAYKWLVSLGLEISVLCTYRSIFIYRCLAAVLHACHEWLWFFFLAGAQIIRKENCFFLPSEKITVTWQCFDHFVNKVRDHLVIKRFRQIAMEQPIRVMRCESNVRMKSKAWALSLVPHFSLSQPRLTFLELGEFHAHSRLARSTIPERKWETTRCLLLFYS